MSRNKYLVKRSEDLKSMGFSSYDAYLRSDLWLGIRARVLSAQPTCELCGQPAECVHHQHYGRKTLEGKTLENLKALCHPCHQYIEFEADGQKTSLRIVRGRFKTLADKFKHPNAYRNRVRPDRTHTRVFGN